MAGALQPEGFELQPDGADFADEGGSEDASHLLPAIRPLPDDTAFAEGAYYTVKLADLAPGAAPRQLGTILGTQFFAALSDMAVFGRDDAGATFRELGPNDNETREMLVAMDLVPSSGAALTEDEFPMFDMVASRIAKKLERAKQPGGEATSAAMARSRKLVGLKGSLGKTYGLKLAGQFDAARITDCALCLGLKRQGDGFGWVVNGQTIFGVRAQGLSLAPGAAGSSATVEFSFKPAASPQPKKVLERMFTAANYFAKKLGGEVQTLAGQKAGTQIMTGEDAGLLKLLQEISALGLRPGNVVTQRLA
ncbi:MAG TPA: hypothetical protein PLF37_16360 [Planctomycetota bacterium]|nr:hypothetical protein [Planctomycetota bacterium]